MIVHNPATGTIVKDALDAYITPKKWDYDRAKTVGASEVGQCSRRIWYIKSTQAHDVAFVDRWGASERGNLIEQQLWAPALKKKYKGKLKFSGDKQHSFRDGPLSATPDGLLMLPRDALKYLGVDDIESDCVLIECKSIDPRVNLTEARHTNVLQAQTQLGCVRAKSKYKPMYAIISYIDASFLDAITEFVIKFDERLYTNLRNRAAMLLGADAATDMKPEGWIAGGRECEHCPFLQKCGIERRNLPSEQYIPVPVDPQFHAEIADMVREALAFRVEAKAANEEYRDLSDQIKTRLRDKGVRKIPGLVSWSNIKGKATWDYDALKEAAKAKGIDISEFMKAGDPTDRLTLSGAHNDNEG
jgi:hypothetical protein